MRIKIDNRLTGISLNPMVDKSFDADFDGDTMAVVHVKTREANLLLRQVPGFIVWKTICLKKWK